MLWHRFPILYYLNPQFLHLALVRGGCALIHSLLSNQQPCSRDLEPIHETRGFPARLWRASQGSDLVPRNQRFSGALMARLSRPIPTPISYPILSYPILSYTSPGPRRVCSYPQFLQVISILILTCECNNVHTID